jgi:hypothetical protein
VGWQQRRAERDEGYLHLVHAENALSKSPDRGC